MRTKHVAFNPMWGSLQYLLDSASDDGWALSHVVSISDYQSVLVFMKSDAPKEGEPEVDENGSYL